MSVGPRGWSEAPTSALVVALALILPGCAAPSTGSGAPPGHIAGRVEPACIPRSTGDTPPIALAVTATEGRTIVARDRVLADRLDVWHPGYRLTVSPGSYVVTSFDGGTDAPMAIRSLAVAVRSGETTHLSLLSACH